MVHGHCHLLRVFRYLGKDISDKSIPKVRDSAKLQDLARMRLGS